MVGAGGRRGDLKFHRGGDGLVAKSCLILRDPIGCSRPGSSVPEISQARILEWVANPCSRGSP